MGLNDQLDEEAADFRNLDSGGAKQAMQQPAIPKYEAAHSLSFGAVIAIISLAAIVLGVICYVIFFRKPTAKPSYPVSCSPEQPYCNQSTAAPKQK